MELVYLQNGTTEKSLFAQDNFTSRRTTGNNLYDPDSLITGKEMSLGLNYYDPRIWPTYVLYKDACEGFITPEEIAEIAPRKRVLSKLELIA